MANSYFQFKQFNIYQDRCAMKVTTDGCLFGAWVAERVGSRESLAVSPSASAFGGLPTEMQESADRTTLDIGTGTGLLSLMIAQRNELSIDAIELDLDALGQASENIAASPWANRIKIFHADVKRFAFPHQYDIMIINPPFYEKELKGNDTRKNIAHHNEGLLLPELLSIIKSNIKSDGTFYLLLPFKRNEEIRKLIIENELAILQLTFVRQSTGHNFFRIMLEGKLKTDEAFETKIDEITIKDEQDQYSPAFANLLKDYYLHL